MASFSVPELFMVSPISSLFLLTCLKFSVPIGWVEFILFVCIK